MSFQSPWLLLSLVVLAAAVGVWLYAERRRMRYAVRFTNMDVLATVVSGRTWPRLVPPALFALALAVLSRRPRATPGRADGLEGACDRDPRHRHVTVDAGGGRRADAIGRGPGGGAHVPRQGTRSPAGGSRRLRRRDAGRNSSDAGSRSRPHGRGRDRHLPDLRRNRDRRRAGDGRRPRESESPTTEVPEGEEIALAARGGTRSFAQATTCDEPGPVSVLFLSDGAQTRGILQPLEGAALARDACFPVFTVALGTPKGTIARGPFGGGGFNPGGSDSQRIPVPPDPETLRQIAAMTGGEFSEARTADALEKAYDNLGSRWDASPARPRSRSCSSRWRPGSCSRPACSGCSSRRGFRRRPPAEAVQAQPDRRRGQASA